jgi:succinyl-CoA synthetase beta subunit
LRLKEYQGKKLFRAVGLPVSEGELATTPQQATEVAVRLGFPAVIKANVLVGGRGKAGGVKLANSRDEVRQQAERILNLTIQGEKVSEVLITRAVEIKREFYLSITLDRSAHSPVIIFSPAGGMEIEEVARRSPEQIYKFHIAPLEGLHPYQIRSMLFQTDLERPLFGPLSETIEKLYQAFTRYHATLVEINPLAISADGSLIAIDSKFIIDDDDIPPELESWSEEASENPLERQAREQGLQYVKLDGTIGVIGNGAGLVMATLDLIQLKGSRPANFLDIGGGANAAQMKKALEFVAADEQVQGIWINIFGGITRCDEVTQGLVEAVEAMKLKRPLVVRLIGTNEAKGNAILSAHGFTPVASMEEGAEAIVRLAS